MKYNRDGSLLHCLLLAIDHTTLTIKTFFPYRCKGCACNDNMRGRLGPERCIIVEKEGDIDITVDILPLTRREIPVNMLVFREVV